MNTAAIQMLRRPTRRLTAHLHDFVSLMKPRVMTLAVFTALVGLFVAPTPIGPLRGSIAILAIAAGAGAAGALNMWYDADIDYIMKRTAMRPIPRGLVSPMQALVFGLTMAGSATAVLGLAVNIMAAALLAFTIFFYVVVYTAWLKRATPQNIVIGGAGGALPPVIGWVAATGTIGVEPFVLFLIIFLWTPPHFWALSLNRTDEYARAGIPMLPVVAGRAATKRQILIYTILLLPISLVPWVTGFAGMLYCATATIGGAVFLALALLLIVGGKRERGVANCLFAYSIFYLLVLFAALLVDHTGHQHSTRPLMRMSRLDDSFELSDLRIHRLQTANQLRRIRIGEP